MDCPKCKATMKPEIQTMETDRGVVPICNVWWCEPCGIWELDRTPRQKGEFEAICAEASK